MADPVVEIDIDCLFRDGTTAFYTLIQGRDQVSMDADRLRILRVINADLREEVMVWTNALASVRTVYRTMPEPATVSDAGRVLVEGAWIDKVLA